MQSDDIILILEDEDLDLILKEEINIVDIDGADHSKLDNLDYEHSGHTGFAPESIIRDRITVDEDNEALLIDYTGGTNNE